MANCLDRVLSSLLCHLPNGGSRREPTKNTFISPALAHEVNSGFAEAIIHMSMALRRYMCNMLVAFSNKALLSNFQFKYPFLLTLMHMLTCTGSCAVMASMGKVVNIVKFEKYKTISQLKKIAVLSVVFCMSVVFGNISLRHIPVSFNQAISATTPAFRAILEYVMQSKVQTRTTYATLIPVVVGIVIASRFEPSFHMWGFIACLIATSLRALKSVVQVRFHVSLVQHFGIWCFILISSVNPGGQTAC